MDAGGRTELQEEMRSRAATVPPSTLCSGGSRGLAIVGAVADDSARAAVEEFVDAYRVRYPVVFGAEAAKAYGGAPALPVTFFIDRRSRIVSSLVGVEDRARLEREVRRLLR